MPPTMCGERLSSRYWTGREAAKGCCGVFRPSAAASRQPQAGGAATRPAADAGGGAGAGVERFHGSPQPRAAAHRAGLRDAEGRAGGRVAGDAGGIETGAWRPPVFESAHPFPSNRPVGLAQSQPIQDLGRYLRAGIAVHRLYTKAPRLHTLRAERPDFPKAPLLCGGRGRPGGPGGRHGTDELLACVAPAAGQRIVVPQREDRTERIVGAHLSHPLVFEPIIKPPSPISARRSGSPVRSVRAGLA